VREGEGGRKGGRGRPAKAKVESSHTVTWMVWVLFPPFPTQVAGKLPFLFCSELRLFSELACMNAILY
jgi:hypothetical protein